MYKKKFKISDEEIKRMYLDGASLNDIAKVAQDTKGLMPLRAKLHELGIDTAKNMKRYRYKISNSCHTYKLNESVFEVIDTEEKAYWLGFLLADGYNHETKTCVAIRLQERDKELLEKLKKFIDTDAPIKTYKGITRTNNLHRNYCELNICSPKFSEILASHNVIQGKTYKATLPILRDDLLSHFIRGVFDGDGCISITPRKDRKSDSKIYQLNFAGAESLLSKIQDILCKETGVTKTSIRRRNNEFAVHISWSGRKQCKKILDYLYKNATIYLKRKYLKYLQLGNSAE